MPQSTRPPTIGLANDMPYASSARKNISNEKLASREVQVFSICAPETVSFLVRIMTYVYREPSHYLNKWYLITDRTPKDCIRSNLFQEYVFSLQEMSLQWRYIGVMASQSNHQQLECFFNSLLTTQRKYQSPTLLVLCEGNPPGTGRFSSQRASNVKSVFMSWCHQSQVIACRIAVTS